MATRRVSCFSLSVEHKPGELSGIMKTLQEHGVDLQAVWGFGMGPGRGEIILQPRDAGRFQQTASNAGWAPRDGTLFEISGDDTPGALVETLDKLSALNIEAVNVVALGGKYAGAIWSAPGDVDKVAQILGA